MSLERIFDVGISVCPNDLYIYAGLLSQAIPNTYRFHIHPLQALNQAALTALAPAKKWDFIKVSLATYPRVENHYALSNVGASFGLGYGPKLVFAEGYNPDAQNQEIKIATPSLQSTASFLAGKLYPHLKQEEAELTEIPYLIAKGVYPGGILINEAMGLMDKLGLVLVCDLAEHWQETTGHPLPLGVVIYKRTLTSSSIRDWESKVQASLLWAQSHHEQALAYIGARAREKDRPVLEKHIRSFTSHAANTEELQAAIGLFLNEWKETEKQAREKEGVGRGT